MSSSDVSPFIWSRRHLDPNLTPTGPNPNPNPNPWLKKLPTWVTNFFTSSKFCGRTLFEPSIRRTRSMFADLQAEENSLSLAMPLSERTRPQDEHHPSSGLFQHLMVTYCRRSSRPPAGTVPLDRCSNKTQACSHTGAHNRVPASYKGPCLQIHTQSAHTHQLRTTLLTHLCTSSGPGSGGILGCSCS